MSWWDRVWATVISEFSDLPDAEDLTRLVLRLSLAAILGALLGFQRETSGKAAGLRTHMLVALGSALFVLMPMQAGMEMDSLSRVMQGVIAGVGFLCAGTIMKRDEDDRVHGLTTAAGLWMTCAIGIAAGAGREMTAVLSTLLALSILLMEKPIQRALGRRGHKTPEPAADS
ncbi:MgtC/SapB family protein [Caenimonas sp. SL110]|uniref:MgtC/SapB family protein n=1 Tax=Caenimonas sp. SL110 TaxID=1450524 RepID=UPI0006541EF2|nr:MgtC/SapB family protein [Caenimonas sp. SL110]